MPVSTTQVISGSIIGVGSSKGVAAVRWGVARSIRRLGVTLPLAGLIGALAWVALSAIGAVLTMTTLSPTMPNLEGATMSFRILPKDPKFFELFIADGENLARGLRGTP